MNARTTVKKATTTAKAKATKASEKVRVAVYARVSTDEQTVDNQLRELKKVARRQGWKVVATFTDNGVSGANSRKERPQFDEMCRAAVRREFDVVMAWSVCRLGRSLQDLIGFLQELHAKDIDLYLHQQGIDTRTPAGKAMFQMMGVFAEFERSIIRERVKAGIERARAAGKHVGRPKISAALEAKIRAKRAEGKGKKKIAREVGVGVGTVHRVLREAGEAGETAQS